MGFDCVVNRYRRAFVQALRIVKIQIGYHSYRAHSFSQCHYHGHKAYLAIIARNVDKLGVRFMGKQISRLAFVIVAANRALVYQF